MKTRQSIDDRCDLRKRKAFEDRTPQRKRKCVTPTNPRPVAMAVSPDAMGEFRAALENQVQLLVVIWKLASLKAIASELFLGDIEVTLECDPEVENAVCVVFRVQASGDLSEIAERRREWYRRTFGLLGNSCAKLRLSIDIA